MKPWYGEHARSSPRAQHLCANRGAAYWRAVVIHAMRAAGHSYRAIGQYFVISPERARQICARPLPPAQVELPVNAEDARGAWRICVPHYPAQQNPR